MQKKRNEKFLEYMKSLWILKTYFELCLIPEIDASQKHKLQWNYVEPGNVAEDFSKYKEAGQKLKTFLAEEDWPLQLQSSKTIFEKEFIGIDTYFITEHKTNENYISVAVAVEVLYELLQKTKNYSVTEDNLRLVA